MSLIGENQFSLRFYIEKNWKTDLVIVGLLILLTLVFFRPVVFGQAWIPRGGGDSVSFIYPMYRFASQSLWQGTIPLWNPNQYAGSPFISDNQSGIFYPFNLLLFLFNPNFSYRAIEGLVIWHILFAGLSMYFCARLLPENKTLAWPAALIAAVAFMFSSVFITHIGNLNLIAVASWLPLAFLALHRAILAPIGKNQLVWAVGGGIALGVGILAGHGQMTFLLAFYLGLYALYQTSLRRSFKPLMALIILALTAGGVAAISLLPSLEGVQYTVRGGFSIDQAVNYSLPWQGLVGIISPDFFGRGADRFWGDWSRVEYGYIGIFTLFLAVIAVIYRRDRLTLFFVLTALLFLILALGSNTPLYPLLLRLLPWFPFQVPARFVLLFDFSVAALATLGADALIRGLKPTRAFFLGSLFVISTLLFVLIWQYFENIHQVLHQQQMIQAVSVFIIFALASWLLIFIFERGWINVTLFGILAVLLLSVDLIGLGRFVEVEWNSPMPGFATDSPALAYLKADPGLHRIDIATDKWQPNLPQIEGLYSIRGVYNPLELSRYAAYIGSVGFRGSTLYNLLGTKYVVGGKKTPPADTNIIVPVFDQDPSVTIFLNTLALPRVNLIPNAVVVSDSQAAFDAVHQEGFDPLQTVILESGQALSQKEAGESSISVLVYEPNNMSFEVETENPAYLLVSDIYHPHWHAAVDSQETPVLVADYALRAILLGPGKHIVEMWFAPPTWIWGAAITALTWIVLAFLLVYFIWRARKKSLNNNLH